MASIVMAGLLVTIHSAFVLVVRPISPQWLVLAGLTLLTGSFSVKIPSIAARISVSEAFTFVSVLLFGPAAATVTVALDSFVMSLWIRRDSRTPLRSIFNLSAVALAIWLSANAFFALTGVQPGQLDRLLPVERYLWQLFVLAALYFLLNSWFVAIALSFERSVKAASLWWENFPWFSLNYFGGVSVAALLVSFRRSIDLNAIGIILPLLLISYLTYRTALGRIADSKRHVDQVNELYMSTIETLAMAVDAKDQITHGHIRRVQVYAIELAKRLGVSDDQQLKAIETAALLHDMGKLAIPEHILNKPGALTPAEFQRMKQHSDLGADLLSSIRFPYPVVPIVRHHHESWDGTGYPAGISRTDIPLGARILAVVDCFDALTSDRPYRPRLTTDDAFAILLERRGTTYDPIVVDTFAKAFTEIAPAAIRAGEEARSMLISMGTAQSPYAQVLRPLKQIRANASETALLTECRHNISRATNARDALEAAAQCLRQLTPASVFAMYRHHPETDSLICEIAVGDGAKLLDALSIKIGQKVTGWSPANRRTSINADASLDLGQISDLFEPPLRSTISAPLSGEDGLVGVLTAYSGSVDAFNETHQYAFEQVAIAIADSIAGRHSKGKQSNIASFQKHRS